MRCSRAVLLAVAALVLYRPAAAADLPVNLQKAPPVAPTTLPAYYWSGFYFGIEGGLGFGHSRYLNADPPTANFGLPLTNSFGVGGALLGGEVGYNWQIGKWLLGVEGDLSWVDQSGSGNDIPPFNPAVSQTTTLDWLATGRIRLGAVPIDRWLVYATGGFAAGDVGATLHSGSLSFSQTQTEWGWTVGMGSEFALTQNWSLKAEYLYVDFQRRTYFSPHIVFPTGGVLVTRSITLDDNIVRAGINYKFP